MQKHSFRPVTSPRLAAAPTTTNINQDGDTRMIRGIACYALFDQFHATPFLQNCYTHFKEPHAMLFLRNCELRFQECLRIRYRLRKVEGRTFYPNRKEHIFISLKRLDLTYNKKGEICYSDSRDTFP